MVTFSVLERVKDYCNKFECKCKKKKNPKSIDRTANANLYF